MYNKDLYELHAHLIQEYDVKFDNVSRRDRGLDPYEKEDQYSRKNLGPYMELVKESEEEHELEQIGKIDTDLEKKNHNSTSNDTESEEEDHSSVYRLKYKHIPTIWDHNFTRFLKYENISMYLNGYARVVKFQITTQDYHEKYNPLEHSNLNRL